LRDVDIYGRPLNSIKKYTLPHRIHWQPPRHLYSFLAHHHKKPSARFSAKEIYENRKNWAERTVGNQKSTRPSTSVERLRQRGVNSRNIRRQCWIFG
jgi:hypothetical protein